MKYAFLLISLSLTFITLNAQSETAPPTVDEILAARFENTGGVDKWKALTATRIEGKMMQGAMEFPGIIYNKRPNLQRIEIDIQGQKIIQAYDGETAWWINPFMGGTEAQPMPPEMAESMVNESFEDNFIDYKEKGHTVEYLGEKEIDGAICYELKLTKKEGDEQFFYFETEHMVPIMQKTMVKSGPMKGQSYETYMSDYEEIGEFVVPTFIETRVNGSAQFSITITKMEFDVDIADDIFAYPEKTEETEEKK